MVEGRHRRMTLVGAALFSGAAVWLGLGTRPAEAAPTEPGQLVNPLVQVNQCDYCHTYNNAPDVADDPLYAPYLTWRGSMMANSARDPVFWAGVAVASQDALDPSETTACIRCHAPRAFLEGRGDAIDIDGLELRDLEGVECELCHRMVDDTVDVGNGNYTLDDVLVGEAVPRRGPWTYGAEGIPEPPHGWIQDDYLGTSEACGTCHDVTTERERLDADGNPTGMAFNEQRTYREWLNSDFAQEDGRSCQDCHMPAVDDMPGCRDHVGQHAHQSGGRRHDLLGVNRFVVELLAADAGILDSSAFEHTLEQMDGFLASAATLEVNAPDSVDPPQGLSNLDVIVTNETGHKLPTGYSEGRVMWLEVVARHDDEVLWSSGTWDARTGLPARDPQLRTYQGVAQEFASGATFHLLRNDVWVEDTRIPPRGLRPDPETDPVTDRYALQQDGTWPHFDTHTYAFDGLDAGLNDGDEIEISVRLLYIVNTAEYVQFLAEDNTTNDAGNDLAMLFDAAGGPTPMVLAEVSTTVPVANTGGGSSTTDASGTSGTSGLTTSPSSSSGAEASSSDADSEGSSGEDPAQDSAGDGCGCRHHDGSAGAFGFATVMMCIGFRRRRRS